MYFVFRFRLRWESNYVLGIVNYKKQENLTLMYRISCMYYPCNRPPSEVGLKNKIPRGLIKKIPHTKFPSNCCVNELELVFHKIYFCFLGLCSKNVRKREDFCRIECSRRGRLYSRCACRYNAFGFGQCTMKCLCNWQVTGIWIWRNDWWKWTKIDNILKIRYLNTITY